MDEAITGLLGLAMVAVGCALLFGWPAALVVIGAAFFWGAINA